jgi:flagellar hook-basal body protein
MDVGAYIAASGAIAVQRDTESITHNLANSSTPGFKRLLNQVESVPFPFQNGRARPPDPLAFAALGGQVKDRSQGELERTGESLDLAIQGPGHFVLRTSAGTQLTRDGHFHLDPSGRLVSRTGLPVEKPEEAKSGWRGPRISSSCRTAKSGPQARPWAASKSWTSRATRSPRERPRWPKGTWKDPPENPSKRWYGSWSGSGPTNPT